MPGFSGTRRTSGFPDGAGGAAAAWGTAACGQAVISEFLASNQAGLTDEDGEHSDWIEIHNPEATAVDLIGWRLTDNAASLG